MNTSGSGFLAPLGNDLPRPEEPDSRQRDEVASMVFAALFACPAPPPPLPAPELAPTHAAPAVATTSWHPAASPMTPAVQGSSSSAIVTHIDSEVLGRVQVAVDQVGTTVRVVVTAERSDVLSAMQARKGQLLGQLQAAGLSVGSLSLVRGEAVGISLAQERSTGTTPLPRKRQGGESSEEAEDPVRKRRGRARAVNLTG
ncbi:MAG: flagellar hook-length control protein FliK [Deltaproteobacteria bacterium]|nr:flagellar hook-length control protein FliK [Deltaproteobacteria bacterium]